jgi:aspartate carbamoyltransferase regulatory subunit
MKDGSITADGKLKIDSIARGIVIDHISAGSGFKVIRHLDVYRKGDNTIACIMNATSRAHGRKDVVKIENLVDVDLAVLGLIAPEATVSIIEGGRTTKKIKLELPRKVVNVLKCKNPRCVTSVEPNAPQIFHLTDEQIRQYRCEYCDDLVVVKGAY